MVRVFIIVRMLYLILLPKFEKEASERSSSRSRFVDNIVYIHKYLKYIYNNITIKMNGDVACSRSLDLHLLIDLLVHHHLEVHN